MTTYWLVSDEDIKEVVTALEDGHRHSSREDKRAYFERVLHTLHSGLHATDAVPSDLQGDPSMNPETAPVGEPRCPKCGSFQVIEPVPAWPSYTCDPCGHDFQWRARKTEARDGS